MTYHTKKVGFIGETIARDYLVSEGYTILGQNYHTRYGEIDIIASPKSTGNVNENSLVFVEVKTRTGQNFGFPEQSVTNTKIEHIIAAAYAYLQENNLLERVWQIDVLAIELNEKGKPTITHYENVTSSRGY